MVWIDSPSLLKRCAYCHESVSVYEGITELGEWYHESCMIHLLLKNCLKYRKKFWDRKLTLGDCIELAEMWNLRQRLLAQKSEFKEIKLVGETRTQTRVLTVKEVACTTDPLASKQLQESVEEAKNRILQEYHKGDITKEQARDRITELMGKARDLARQPGLRATPILIGEKPVVSEVQTTVKEFKYQVTRPDVIQTISKEPLKLTTAQEILDQMNGIGAPGENPVIKLLANGENQDDGVEVLKRYRLPGKIEESQSDEGNSESGSKEERGHTHL